jgi:predicted porin
MLSPLADSAPTVEPRILQVLWSARPDAQAPAGPFFVRAGGHETFYLKRVASGDVGEVLLFMIIKFPSFPALTLAVVASTSTALAIDAGGIAIHGSVSLTGAYSDKYNYYGDTAENFDLNVKELTLNGTYRFENGLRAAAQVYAYDLAGYSDLTLDFATLDYSFNEYAGIRAGRNKLPQGLYGEVQDLDQIRTFASLPLNFYPRGLRSLSAGYNGAALYGTIPLAHAGSLEYQAVFGWMENVDGEAPYARGVNDFTRTEAVDVDQVYGGNLTWNTPVEGLKFAFTYTRMPEIRLYARVQTRAALAEIGSAFSPIADMIDMGYGAGTWDHSGLFAGSSSVTDADAEVNVFSAEYTHDKWVLSGEFKRMDSEATATLLAAPPFGVANQKITSSEEHAYVQATYQATDKLGLGIYYAQSDFDPKDGDARDDKFTSVDDLALGASYALTGNWLIKVEGHALDGLGRLNLAGDTNLGATDARWNYFVVKTTFSF